MKDWALWLLLAGYLCIGTLYATQTPPWQAPDEPAHYNYVRQLAQGELPVIEPGDYDQAYQSTVISARFDPQYSIDPFEYEDWQPPLYYLLLTPLFWLGQGSLLVLRLGSVLIGAGVVALTYATARAALPDQRWLSLTATVFVAFLPQHVAMLAAVNNDALAELLIAGLLFLLVRLFSPHTLPEPETRRLWGLVGLLLGLGFLTKATVYIMAPLIGLLLLWRYWGDGAGFWRAALAVGMPAFLLGAVWWGRNLVVYGGLDIIGKEAHDAVVVGQPTTASWIAQYGWRYTLGAFLRTTFQSFWGQFGWMGVLMPGWYNPLRFFTIVILGGLALRPRFARRPRLTAASWTILLGTFLLSGAVYLGYNVTYVQHQGRYLFPAIVPIGVAVALGLSAWLQPLPAPSREWLTRLLPAFLALALFSLDLIALYRFIIPSLALP